MEKATRCHDTLFGEEGKPGESLLIQIRDMCKELNSQRDNRDKDRCDIKDLQPRVAQNEQTNKNLVKLMWIVVVAIISTIVKIFISLG